MPLTYPHHYIANPTDTILQINWGRDMLGNLSNGWWGLILCIQVLLISVDVHAENLRVGFAQLAVTPEVLDSWVDVNNDAQFDPDIDTWTDGNGNGTFLSLIHI